jgi:hypothetical protein
MATSFSKPDEGLLELNKSIACLQAESPAREGDKDPVLCLYERLC